MELSLIDILDEATSKYADKLAIRTESNSYSYIDFQNVTINFAKQLLDVGCANEGFIGVYLERSFEMVLGIFGILRIGSAYVPADPNNPSKRTSLLYKNLNIKYVVTSKGFKAKIEEMGFVAIVPELGFETPQHVIGTYVSPNSTAYILFTSGSTGEPKGVVVSHNSVVNLVTYIQDRYPLLEGEKVLLKSPYTFDGSVWELFGWIMMGGTLCICNPGDEKNPRNLASLIAKEQINFLFFVPSMLSVFIDYIDSQKDSINLSSLKWVSVGGEVLTPTLVKHFYKALKNPQLGLINVYGPTETTVYATTYLCDPTKEYTKLPIGEVVTGDYIYILDSDLIQVTPGTEGEICIGGVGVAKGYFNSENYTNEKFITDPVTGTGKVYRTGDIGKQLPNGLYDFVGRKDFQVKLRGQRIELGEIENALQQIEGVLECVVLFAKDRNKDDSLIAYLRTITDNSSQIAEFQLAEPHFADYIRAALMEFIPKYMVPSEIILCSRFPLNHNGKIDRSALPPISSLIDLAPKVGFQPQSKDEETIYSIWKRILSRDSIAPDEDFFQAGGHSLKAIQVITEIIKSFDLEIPLSLFYNKLTLPLICSYIADNVNFNKIEPDYKSKTKSENNSFSLTPVQTEMWVMNSFDPSGLTHNIQIEFTIEGKFDLEQFLAAFNQTIKSEDSFRSIFPFNGTEPVQQVLDSVVFEMPFCDLSYLEMIQKDEKYAEIIYRNGHVLFDFNKLPLFSLFLVKWENDSYRLLMAIHHIIFDGWSLSLFMQRVLLRYNGKEPQKGLYTNGDYSHWLKAHYTEHGYDKEFLYWEKALQHIPNRLALPTKAGADFSKAGMFGKRHWWSLPEKLTSQIDSFAISQNTTPFVVLMGAFQIVLAKHANQREIVVGTPFANRQHPMTAELLGYYTNMVSIPSVIGEGDTYSDFIARCNDTSIGSFSNAMLPFGELVKKLGLKFEPGAYPIYQAIFVLQNWPHQPTENAGFRFTQKEIGNETSKMDLLLNVEKCDETYKCWLEYDTQLFDKQFIATLAIDIENTLGRIVSFPQRKILNETSTVKDSVQNGFTDTCIIIGEGSLAIYCSELLFQKGFSIRKIISEDAALLGFANAQKIKAGTKQSDKAYFEQVDYLFSINNSYILTADILEKVKKFAINYHDSPLPKYAGMYATNQAILQGETSHGVSWHCITAQIDAGDILASAKVDLLETDTAYTLNMRCYEAAMNSFRQLLEGLKIGDLQPKPQDIAQRSFYSLANRPAGFGIIDWQSPVSEIGKILRACDFGGNSDNAFLLPYIWVNNKFYNLLKASVFVGKNTKPGLVSLTNSSITIGCKDGFIKVEKLSDQAGKEIAPSDILFPDHILNQPKAEFIEQIHSHYKKWVKFEAFWVRQFQQSEYFKLSILAIEKDFKDDWFLIEDIDSQWIDLQNQKRSETFEALVAYYFLRLSRKNKGTFAYLDRQETEKLPFGEWKTLNITIEGNVTLGETITNISYFIAELKTHGNFLSNILERFPSLTDLRGKIPSVFIVKEGANISFNTDGLILIQVNQHSIRIKGINPSISEALKSFLAIAGQYLNVQNCRTPLMAEAMEKNIRSGQNVEVCKPVHIVDVVSAFNSVSAVFHDRNAIFDSGKYYTYSQFNQEVGQFASLLRQSGIQHNSVVAISLGRCYEYFLSVMAVLHCGAVFLPLDPSLPMERRKFMITDSGAKLLVHSSKTDLSDNGILTMDLEALNLSGFSVAKPFNYDESTLAYIMYTSGSTGTPKGVKISRKALASFVGGALGLYRINENDRILQFANLAFDASIEEIFCAFCSGAALYLRNEEMLDPEKLLSFTIEHEITVWDLPTAFWRQLLSFEVYRQQNQLTKLKLVIIGGEATTLSDYALWKSLGEIKHELFNTYGPTETTVVSLAYKINQLPANAKEIPIGRVFPGNTAAIVDHFGFQLPEGVAGELIISGNNVADGYVNARENQTMLFGLDEFSKLSKYNTGDLVASDKSGNIHYLGRVDEQLKIRGFRVEPKEIELFIRKIAGVENAVVTGFVEAAGNKVLTAFYTGKSLKNDPDFIKKQLQEGLPAYMVPAIIIHLEKIPLTQNGKSDLLKLNQLAARHYSDWRPSHVPPVGKTEISLHAIWQAIFKKDFIGVEDDFFDIGGHSLKAVQLMAGIKQKFGTELPLSALIAKPTIRLIAELIESKNTDYLWDVIVPIRRQGSLPPLFLIHGAGLNILLYQSLTKHLKSDRPIYALQAKGLDGKQTISTSIGEMAEHYLKEIKKVQPIGPYYFLGFSLGGFIGFEMSRKLTKQNEKVNFLGVIDSVASLADENLPFVKGLWLKLLKVMAVPTYLIWLFINEPWNKKLDFIKTKSNNFSLIFRYYSKKALVLGKKGKPSNIPEKVEPVYLNDDLKIKLIDALKLYKIIPADVQLDLFKAEKATFYIPDRKSYGWSKYACKGVIPHIIPGEHSSMFAPPNDSFFAQILEERLATADQTE